MFFHVVRRFKNLKHFMSGVLSLRLPNRYRKETISLKLAEAVELLGLLKIALRENKSRLFSISV